MPETYGLPTYTGNWLRQWMAADGEQARGDEPTQQTEEGEFFNASAENEAMAGNRRSKSHTPEHIERVLRDALGDEFDEDMDLSDMGTVSSVINESLTDPGAAFRALDVSLADRAPTYRAQEEAFAESKGMVNKKAANPPSRRPDARHRAYIQKKATRLGVSIAEAAAMTTRKPKRATRRQQPSERPVHL